MRSVLTGALGASSASACHGAATDDPAEPYGGDASSVPFGAPPAGIDPFDSDASLGARASALFATCGGGGPEQSCHATGAGGTWLRLGPDGDLVGIASTERPEMLRVRSGAPDDSYLFLKVRGDGGIEGGVMPRGSDGDARIVDLVQRWIEAGAPPR